MIQQISHLNLEQKIVVKQMKNHEELVLNTAGGGVAVNNTNEKLTLRNCSSFAS